MKVLLTIFIAAVALVFAYFFIGVVTVLKNGTSISQSPGTLIRLKTFFVTHIAETSEQSAYPELKPRQYPISDDLNYDNIIDSIKLSANSLGYSIEKESNDQIELVMTTALFKFKDDVIVSISTQQGFIIVNARSESRVGRADFGANIANIVKLFKDLDQRLLIK
jgi:uncharacterized protein (DUF1499 family)